MYLFILPISGLCQPRTPLNRAFLVSDLDGNSKAATNINISGESISIGTIDSARLGNAQTNTIGVTFDGAGAVIADTANACIQIPYNCTIRGVTMMGKPSGSIVVDVAKTNYLAWNNAIGPSICGASKPTITSNKTNNPATSLSGWSNVVITNNEVLTFTVSGAVTTTTNLVLQLTVTKD